MMLLKYEKYNRLVNVPNDLNSLYSVLGFLIDRVFGIRLGATIFAALIAGGKKNIIRH